MRRSSPVKHWLAFGAVGTAAAAIALTGMPAASAAGSYLSFSLDGGAFGPAPGRPVFDQSVNLVPGGSVAGNLWVRNDGTEAAYLSAGAVNAGTDPELAGMVSVAGSYGSEGPDGGVPVYLGGPGSCSDVHGGWELDPGDSVRIELTAGLSPEAPNLARNHSARFDMVFYLESAQGSAGTTGACGARGIIDDDGARPSEPVEPPVAADADAAGVYGGNGIQVRQDTAAGPEGVGLTATGSLAEFPAARDVGGAGAAQDLDTGFNTRLLPEAPGNLEGAAPASFQSTVEPVIRSLSGTLLIALSVAFCTAAGIRLRSRTR